MHPPQQTATTTLQQPWLNIARALWIILSTTAVVALIASTVRGWGAPLPACTAPGAVCGPWAVSQEDMALAAQAGLPMPAMMAFYYASSLLPKMFFILVGVFIFWRRSDNWVALLLSLMLTLWAVEGVENLGAAMPLVTMLYAIPTGIFILLPFVFPDGRFVPRWTLWVAWPLAAISIVATILPQLGLPLNDRVYAGALLSPFSLWFGLAGYAVVYRYRRISNRMEQPQTKWVLASILGNASRSRFGRQSRGRTAYQPQDTGPTNGFWANAEWLPCTDGKARAVEPGSFPLADGAAARVGRLRGYGNAIVRPQAVEFIRAYTGISTGR